MFNLSSWSHSYVWSNYLKGESFGGFFLLKKKKESIFRFPSVSFDFTLFNCPIFLETDGLSNFHQLSFQMI